LVFHLALDPQLHTPCISSPNHHHLFAAHAHTNAACLKNETLDFYPHDARLVRVSALALCLSVCHKSVFYQNGWMDQWWWQRYWPGRPETEVLLSVCDEVDDEFDDWGPGTLPPRDRSWGIPPMNSPASAGGPSLDPCELTVPNPPDAATGLDAATHTHTQLPDTDCWRTTLKFCQHLNVQNCITRLYHVTHNTKLLSLILHRQAPYNLWSICATYGRSIKTYNEAVIKNMLCPTQCCIAKNGGGWRAWRYPAYLWSLRWVYAVKKTRRLVYGVYPRIPPIHHWSYMAVNIW